MDKNIKKNDKNLSIHNNWFNDTLISGFELGLVQVYTGNGKGKTTAAIGQALRACGHNLKSVIIQFLKGGSYTGEFKIQEKLQPFFKIYQFGNPYFINKNCIREEDLDLNRNGFKLAFEIATQQNDIHILVLDEINVAVNIGIIK
ncbi:MAG: cob(I)yrinic acid a,c-diamide adenosyltransferase, partial [bacterium]